MFLRLPVASNLHLVAGDRYPMHITSTRLRKRGKGASGYVNFLQHAAALSQNPEDVTQRFLILAGTLDVCRSAAHDVHCLFRT
jgi:hypothetical protein